MTVMPAILSRLELQITLYVGTSQSHLQLHKAFLVAFAWSVPSSLSIPSCHYLRSFISSLVLCISQSCCGLFCNSLVIRLLFSQSSVGYSGWLFYILVLITVWSWKKMNVASIYSAAILDREFYVLNNIRK